LSCGRQLLRGAEPVGAHRFDDLSGPGERRHVQPPAGSATARLCEQDEECKNGQRCIAQTCIFGAMFKLCGLQSQAPYNCTAN
jgi:hypothetical protein